MKIIRLAELTKKHVALAGGKGANLGELTAAGLPVPPGFVVTTDAFRTAIQSNGLHSPTAETIRALTVPPEMQAEIKAAFDLLGSPFVAVRSSATAEDGAAHAWAGQLESFVPTNPDVLMQNIKNCWASLYNPRAIAYRQQAGLAETEVAVTVIVQSLVDADVSGVAFSAHPVTGNRQQAVVEAVFGLGEAAVGGYVTPDTYVLTKATAEVLEHYPADQPKQLVRVNGAAEWQPTARSGAKLTTAQLAELGGYIRTIEKYFGFACDIEWTLQGKTFYIVQSRPITTLQGV